MPDMDPLFGSETRARVLEQLALSPQPQTAYRIAKAIGAEPIQVIKILTSLAGFLEHTAEGWSLSNRTLRQFLRERSAREGDEARREKDELLVRFGMKPSTEYERRQVR